MTDSAGKILVVDDNEDNRDLLARRLKRKGYEVETAEDGPTCLAMIEAGAFDVIVLDIMMPGMSGIEVLEILRETYSQGELPILMATAKSDSADMIEALAKGANDYVTKPIDFPVVLARLESHMKVRTAFASVSASRTVLALDGTAEPGTVLDGRYEIVERIGEGGFAVVYHAKQLSTGQKVAIKLLRAHRVAALSIAKVELARFEREMKLIGKLRHPHIVRLIDSGNLEVQIGASRPSLGSALRPKATPGGSLIPLTRVSQGDASEEPEASGGQAAAGETTTVPYIVMEYVEGRPLSDLFDDEAPIGVERSLELLLPLISALGAAHQAGVIHRDLKPANILVNEGRGGRLFPKVLDFGIAKLTDDDSMQQLTMDSGFIGTPEYMAPEQARGARDVDGRADQYALGVLLYECITGKRPYESESFIELLHMISKGDLLRPRARIPSIDADFEAVLLRSLDPDPERRFSHAEAFGRALLPFASEDIRAQWSSAFDVSTDPPPPPRAERPGGAAVRREMGEAQTMNRMPTLEGTLSESPSAASVGLDSSPMLFSTRGGAGHLFVGAVMGAVLMGATIFWIGPHEASGGVYTVTVEVRPPTARLVLDGELAGSGHLERVLSRDGEAHHLRVEAEGFLPETFSFRDTSPPARVELRPLSSP